MVAASPPPSQPARSPKPPGWHRVGFTLGTAALVGLVLSLSSILPAYVVVLRAMIVGMSALLAFVILEGWPRNMPRWLPRWAAQLVGVVAVVPFGAYAAYWITLGGNPQLAQNEARLVGYLSLAFAAILFAPWVVLGAMVRQRDAFARQQALTFELERSELARKALDSRLRLLQAQVEPHFLFNTLANVRELVDSGSPQASRVLDSLITYLRGVVPRLNETVTTLGQEVQLVRSYLELMQLRMPDRLRFELQVDPEALELRCPPATLLTLVENAVRHGIDPSEEGGRIEVRVEARDGRCRAQVRDDGIGLGATGVGLGTGLASLRERLELLFGGDARLTLFAIVPRGACVEVDFPAQRISP